VRSLQKLPARRRGALLARLEAIAADPYGRHANVKALQGERNAFRLRVGDWRAIYRLDDATDTMRVTRFEPRGSVY
jgi:mRNA interferase RelE/StbE